MEKELKKLVDKAKELKEKQNNCKHEFISDGESKIVPNTIRSYVCKFCGMRISPSKFIKIKQENKCL